jgi:hypothetical protein
MYIRATTIQETTPACSRRQRIGQRSIKDLSLVNNHGDSYRQNKSGQVTEFLYKQSDKSYEFEYTEAGELQSIASSDGWSWTRICDSRFDGWVIRNYFDSWTVSRKDCESVTVGHEGIQAIGAETAQMGLPLRS